MLSSVWKRSVEITPSSNSILFFFSTRNGGPSRCPDPANKSPFVIAINGSASVASAAQARNLPATGSSDIADVHTTAATRKSRAKLPAGKKSAGRVSQSKTAKEDPNRIVEVESDDSPPYLPAAADAASIRGGSGSLQ